MENLLTVVLSRERSSTAEGRALEKALLDGLNRWPELPVLVLPHLYDLLPRGMGFEALREIRTNLLVFSWLYPRAAFWVLQANGVRGQMGQTPLVPEEELEPPPRQSGRSQSASQFQEKAFPGGGSSGSAAESARTKGSEADQVSRPSDAESVRTIWCLDLRTPGNVEDYLAEIERLVELTGARAVSLPEPDQPITKLAPYTMQEITELLQPRWYPVIDQSRCTNCHECLNFCLFGVYGLDGEGRVWVEMPDACRPGCPACARVCPSGAIMFPHYSDPAIAGAPDKAGRRSQKESACSEAGGPAPSQPSGTEPTPPPRDSQAPLDRLVNELDQMEP